MVCQTFVKTLPRISISMFPMISIFELTAKKHSLNSLFLILLLETLLQQFAQAAMALLSSLVPLVFLPVQLTLFKSLSKTVDEDVLPALPNMVWS